MATYGKPYRLDTTWCVTETGDDGTTVTVFLASQDDKTAGKSVEYDSVCSWCYLGAAHSLNAHNQSLNERGSTRMDRSHPDYW